MLKKLLIVPFMFGVLGFTSNAEASEIKDITDLQEIIALKESKTDVLLENRKELVEEKKQEIQISEQTKKAITPVALGMKTKEVTYTIVDELPAVESTIDDELNAVSTELLETETETVALKEKLNTLVTFENVLDESLNGNSYDVTSESLDGLKNKLTKLTSKIDSIKNYSIELEDTTKKELVISSLTQVKEKLVYDIENYVTDGEQVVDEALKYLGTPYVWGGRNPGGFDCSGLTQYVYRQVFGKEIGSWTVPQESSGTIRSVGEAEVGDLLFWGSQGSTYHVGIYMGGGQFIHAPQPGDSVKITNLSDFMPSFSLSVY